MKKPTLSRTKKQRGSAFVEMALVFLISTVMIIGVIDLAQMLFIHQAVINQLRSAGRWAAVNAYDASQITNVVLYGKPTGTTGSALFGMTAANVQVEHDISDGLYADRIKISASGYSYLLFSGAIANMFRGEGPTVQRVGLTASITVPHEYIEY